MSNIALYYLASLSIVTGLNTILLLRVIQYFQALKNFAASKPLTLPFGQIAPDFAAETLTHADVTLANYRGCNVAFVFILSDCSTCREKLPMLNALDQRSRAKSRPRIVVVSSGPFEETRKLFDEYNLDIQVLVPSLNPNASTKTGALSPFVETYVPGRMFPVFVFIDSNGIVALSGTIESSDWKLFVKLITDN